MKFDELEKNLKDQEQKASRAQEHFKICAEDCERKRHALINFCRDNLCQNWLVQVKKMVTFGRVLESGPPANLIGGWRYVTVLESALPGEGLDQALKNLEEARKAMDDRRGVGEVGGSSSGRPSGPINIRKEEQAKKFEDLEESLILAEMKLDSAHSHMDSCVNFVKLCLQAMMSFCKRHCYCDQH